MSKTLSKILVICALAVVFPLMIVGTAFASFYSLDATLVVEAYAGIHNMPADAFAQVKYEDSTAKELTITKGHLSEIELNTLSEGYDFVGWFNGTVEDYAAETNPTFVSTDEKLSVKVSDYSNLVAVYELKSYNVSWNYLANPENTTDFSISAPPNAKATYYWGDALPVLEYAHYDFNGWTVEGSDEFLSVAKFENSGNVALNAAAASWSAHGQVTVNYYDEGGNLIDGASETIYKASDYTLKNIADVVSVETGYKYSWADSSNNVVDSVINIAKTYENPNFNLYLKKEVVNYSATLVQDVPAYKKDTTIAFTKQDASKLEEIFDEENWNMYSFFEIESIKFNSNNYTQAQIADLVNAMIASESDNLEIEAVVSETYSTFSATKITYEATSGSGNVYDKNGDSYAALDTISATRESTWTLEEFLGIQWKTLTDSDNSANAQVLKLDCLKVVFTNGGWCDYAVSEFGLTNDMTMYDLIEIIVTDSRNAGINFGSGDTFEISTLTAIFAPEV